MRTLHLHQGRSFKTVFEGKRGGGVLSGKADLCIYQIYLCLENADFCGWLMGFLPYVATKCTANNRRLKKPLRGRNVSPQSRLCLMF